MDRVGSRPATGARTRVVTNGAANGAVTNGLGAKTNGATSHRPGTNGTAKVQPVVKLTHGNQTFGKTAVLQEMAGPVRRDRERKHPRGPKKAPPRKAAYANGRQVATARRIKQNE